MQGWMNGLRDRETYAIGVLETRFPLRFDHDGLAEVKGEIRTRLLLVREGHLG